MKMFRRWRYPFFEFCLRFWNLAAAIFLVLRISATRKGASYPPTKRVYSLIEFLLDSAKRQNYAVCMCVCRFYIYLPPLSSLSYIHKPTNSDLYYHRIHLYSRDSVNLSDPPWKIAYFNHLRTCPTAILRCNPYTPLYFFTMKTESLCPCQCLDSLEFLRDSGLSFCLCAEQVDDIACHGLCHTKYRPDIYIYGCSLISSARSSLFPPAHFSFSKGFDLSSGILISAIRSIMCRFASRRCFWQQMTQARLGWQRPSSRQRYIIADGSYKGRCAITRKGPTQLLFARR